MLTVEIYSPVSIMCRADTERLDRGCMYLICLHAIFSIISILPTLMPRCMLSLIAKWYNTKDSNDYIRSVPVHVYMHAMM